MQITPRHGRATSPAAPAAPLRGQPTSHTPQVNIAYGSYYLRYLLDRYGGNEMLALAAYNGGRGQRRPLDRASRAADRDLSTAANPVPRDPRRT